MAKGDISLDTSHINWLQRRNFLLSQVGSEFFDISTVGKNCISRCQPAHVAALYARPACLELLLDAGHPLTGSLEKAYLAHCAAQGLGAALAEGRGGDSAECLELILDRAPLQAGALDDYKRTPLHLVCATVLPGGAAPSVG